MPNTSTVLAELSDAIDALAFCNLRLSQTLKRARRRQVALKPSGTKPGTTVPSKE